MSCSARQHKPQLTRTVFLGTRHLKPLSQAPTLRSRFPRQKPFAIECDTPSRREAFNLRQSETI